MLQPEPLISFLETLEDTRRGASCDHKFIDILIIAVCAIICDADSWEDMQGFGEDKEEWFRQFLELPSGIPSHDTFYRTFCSLDPKHFQACFTRWVKSAFPDSLEDDNGKTHIIPIDGKVIKGSRGKGKGKKAVHLVSAWSSRLSLVLGQKKVDKKSNEITAVPELLEAIDLKGCMITADAMSCQKTIAETCVAKEADYLLAVKGMIKKIRMLGIRKRTDLSLVEIARWINPIINGWINYYGCFYRSELYRVFREVNKALIWWARHKYKKLQRRKTRAGKFMEKVAETHRYLFAHWRAGMKGSMV